MLHVCNDLRTHIIVTHAHTLTLSPLTLSPLTHTHTQAWLAGANPCPNIQTGVDSAVLSHSKTRIREALDSNFQGPQQHMESYGEA